MTSENGNTTYQILWDAAQAGIGKTSLVINTYKKKKKKKRPHAATYHYTPKIMAKVKSSDNKC